MTKLILTAAEDASPISIEIVSRATDELIKVVLLSMAKPEVSLDLEKGNYLLVGTRAQEPALMKSVNLSEEPVRIEFEGKGSKAQPTWPPVLEHLDLDEQPSVYRNSRRRLIGAAGDLLRSLPFGPWQRVVYLREWRLYHKQWVNSSEPLPYDISNGRLEISFGDEDVRAISLQDQKGHGPIIIVPPFQSGLNISFYPAAVLQAGKALPPGVMMPVAETKLKNRFLWDLLQAATSASLPGMAQLWPNETVEHDHSTTGQERANTFEQILKALFLIRYRPKQVSGTWLRRLVELEPAIADGPTLLAWHLIIAGSGDEKVEALGDQIRRYLSMAQERPCMLFATSRSMLMQALRLYGSRLGIGSAWARSAAEQGPANFLSAAINAGGLEAFWGANPTLPGREHKALDAKVGAPVYFRQGTFSGG